MLKTRTEALINSFTLGYFFSFFNEYFINSERLKYPRESEEQLINLFYLNLPQFSCMFNQVLEEEEILSKSVSGNEDFKIFFVPYFEYVKEKIDEKNPKSIGFAFFMGSLISLILISGPMDFDERDIYASLFLFLKDLGIEWKADGLLKKARLFLSEDDELRRIARKGIFDILLEEKRLFSNRELLENLDPALYYSRLLY